MIERSERRSLENLDDFIYIPDDDDPPEVWDRFQQEIGHVPQDIDEWLEEVERVYLDDDGYDYDDPEGERVYG